MGALQICDPLLTANIFYAPLDVIIHPEEGKKGLSMKSVWKRNGGGFTRSYHKLVICDAVRLMPPIAAAASLIAPVQSRIIPVMGLDIF